MNPAECPSEDNDPRAPRTCRDVSQSLTLPPWAHVYGPDCHGKDYAVEILPGERDEQHLIFLEVPEAEHSPQSI